MILELLYYFVFVFGLLLLSYTTVTWVRIRALVNSGSHSLRAQRIQISKEKFKNTIRLWFYYYCYGNPKNYPKSVLISVIAFLGLYILNYFYVHLTNITFVLLFLLAFVIVVWKLGKRRNKKIFEQSFPEILQVLNSASSAGVGLLQALERCGKDIDGPVGQEFKSIYRRLSIGEDPISVFEDSYTRYPYKEYYFFIMIIRLNLSRGGQIREVISRLGRAVANSKKNEQKKRAMTAEARMSAMIVACFPIGFFLFMQVTMPENFEFVMYNPSGRIILYYVFGSVSLGMGIIWWLMKKAT
ncbi:type II secretion system F family protein [Basilea psittacipulmonis]|uniref:MaoC protein n=1 Tax=Basilea psittacipulmonis DSM 24701 TaxID=1072685 RepID=A0A077DG07_9BURK|nr:type II secretion system F family protein [Basilea psittacipulmonis]AIL32362.1 MaoC protein [Basilea psittacipulmonis DSM 24701]